MSLADARQRARDALREAQGGTDIAAQKIDARQAETFAELATEYINLHASKKRSGREDVRILRGSPHKKRTGKTPHVPIVARWGTRKVKEINRRDVRELVDEVGLHAPIMANRVLALARKVFNFGIDRDWLEVNPCHRVIRAAPERARAPRAAVSADVASAQGVACQHGRFAMGVSEQSEDGSAHRSCSEGD